jgi:protein SCO1/2
LEQHCRGLHDRKHSLYIDGSDSHLIDLEIEEALMSTAVRVWLTVLMVLATAYAAFAGYRHWKSDEEHLDYATSLPTVARSLSDFTFTERSGRKVNLTELGGKPWVASFFFSSCPGSCRQMNQVLAGLEKELIEQGVTVVSISVDPEVDTPETLANYADQLGADRTHWLFLTGPLRDAQELGEGAFGVSVHGKDHSDRLILVDGEGKVQGRYRSTESLQIARLKEKIAELKKASAT